MTAPVALSRVDKVAAIRASLAANPSWTHREVANELGMTLGALRGLLNDPDGSKQRQRRQRYQRPCPDCGTLMDGSNGYSGPARCLACFNAAKPRAEHGSRAKYNAGCRCDACRESVRIYVRSLKGRPAPTHGASGYSNYGCRCQVCKAAHSARMRRRRSPA